MHPSNFVAIIITLRHSLITDFITAKNYSGVTQNNPPKYTHDGQKDLTKKNGGGIITIRF